MKVVVGQTVYVTKGRSLEKATVVKVGRKYFEVQIESYSYLKIKFYIEDGVEANSYSRNSWRAYLSLQEIEDGAERARISLYLSETFSTYLRPLTLDQLRRIKAIVEERKGSKNEA